MLRRTKEIQHILHLFHVAFVIILQSYDHFFLHVLSAGSQAAGRM